MADNKVEDVVFKLCEWKDRLTDGSHKLVKLDVKELYPSVPPKLACERMFDCMKTQNVLDVLLNDLGIDEARLLKDLVEATSGNMVECGGKIYLQVQGLPIGSTISGLLANF
jgi:hypothetical protein